MVMTFTTNENNDIFIGPDGNLSISTGLQGVLQACATATKAQLGEMCLATTSGIPNFQTVWVGSPNLAIWQKYLRTTIENVEGVIEVTELDVSVANNILSYTATIRSIYGPGEING